MASPDTIIDVNQPLADKRDALRPDGGVSAHETASGARSPVPEPLSATVDRGEPVDNPPPFIEPVGFDEPPSPPPASVPGQRPPRRTFLAPLPAAPEVGRVSAAAADAVPMVSPPAEAALVDASATEAPPVDALLVEANSIAPTAAPAIPPTPVIAAPPAVDPQKPAGLLALARRWRAAAETPRVGRRPRRLYWARWPGVAAVVVGVAYVTGAGRFASSMLFPRSSGPAVSAPSTAVDRLAYFQHGAEAGDPGAELQLAILYAKGEGVTQDYATAATWFRKAADQGSARAQYDLGVLYERGRGVAADPEQAAAWYLKAAEGKYPLAQYNLAVAYTKGQGTRKDLTEAAVWYRRAAGQGVVQAMVNLGMLYERGEGVAVSPVDAYAWYLAAGRRGNQAAAQRATDVFNGMSQQDQIRAEALASDVAGSIHDAPESGASPAG